MVVVGTSGRAFSEGRHFFFFNPVFWFSGEPFALLFMSATGQELSTPKTHAVPEVKFAALLESIPEAIVGIDAAGRIVLANEIAEHMFGCALGIDWQSCGITSTRPLPRPTQFQKID